MYKCRRVIAILLSLAVVTSFFVFSASADTPNAPISFYWMFSDSGKDGAYDVGNYYSCDNNYVTFQMHKAFKITKLLIKHDNTDCDFYVKLNINFVTDSNQYSNHSVNVSSGDGTKYKDSNGTFISYPPANFPNDINLYDTFYPIKGGRSILIHFTHTAVSGGANYTEITLTNPIIFWTAAGDNITPVISGFEYYHDLYGLVNSGFTTTNTYLSSISNSTSQLLSHVSNIWAFESNLQTNLYQTYYWTQTEYDSTTGTLTNRQESGDFFHALLGSIQSISSSNEQQAALQDKANQNGAGDALDDAYSGSSGSFGSLSDFKDISDMASWNSGNYSQSVTSGLTGWFSLLTERSIDNVAQSRAPQEEIIDFYSSNLEDLLEGIGD